MAHRVKLVRAKVKRYDSDLGCDVTRGIGWRLVCSCGQRSRVATRIAELREWEHVRHRQRIG